MAMPASIISMPKMSHKSIFSPVTQAETVSPTLSRPPLCARAHRGRASPHSRADWLTFPTGKLWAQISKKLATANRNRNGKCHNFVMSALADHKRRPAAVLLPGCGAIHRVKRK
jgi:hypothetical protein